MRLWLAVPAWLTPPWQAAATSHRRPPPPSPHPPPRTPMGHGATGARRSQSATGDVPRRPSADPPTRRADRDDGEPARRRSAVFDPNGPGGARVVDPHRAADRVLARVA